VGEWDGRVGGVAQLMVLLFFSYKKSLNYQAPRTLIIRALCAVPRDTPYQSSAALRSSWKNFNLAASELIASTVALSSR
jgi:hypothetical protein